MKNRDVHSRFLSGRFLVRVWVGFLLAMRVTIAGFGQNDTTQGKWDFSAYLEVYYGYDVDHSHTHARPAFLYSYNRRHEFNLNLGMARVAYTRGRMRANLGLMAGTYANANLSAEPATLRNIYEANVGYRANKAGNVWVEAGIFPSHIGFESAIGKDCWNLTRSILADNSPYYETGLKASHTSASGKWFLSGMVLNGWQHIVRQDGRNWPGAGHQVTWKPSGKVMLNSSSFIGNEKADSVRQMRYFHNFYGIFQVAPRWGVTVGFDIGAEQRAPRSRAYNYWYAPIVMVRSQLGRKVAVAVRGEYYVDSREVIIATGTANGFQTLSWSANVDVALWENLLWRVEGRGFQSRDAVFGAPGDESRAHWGATTSLAVSF
jgi:hypothetical protein